MYFLLTKELNRRLAQQYKELLIFNFRIDYVKGSENNAVDALSRRTNYIIDVQQSFRAMLVQNKDKSLGPNKAKLYIIVTIAVKIKRLI